MNELAAILLTINGALLLVLAWLWFWTKLVTGRPRTVPEAAVRALHYAARWLTALAEGLDSGILAYREMRRSEMPTPRGESDRLVWAVRRSRQLQRWQTAEQPASCGGEARDVG